MKSLLKIYGKYIGFTWVIVVLLMITNISILGWIMYELYVWEEPVFHYGVSGMEEIRFEETTEGKLILTREGEDYLVEKNFLFLMVLDEKGDQILAWNLPKEIKEHYAAGEIASFSRWYLEDYPVRVWNTEKGLLVAGREKGSIWKYSLEFSEDFMRHIGTYFRRAFEINLLVIVCVIVFLGYRYYRSLHPLVEGIAALSANRKIHLSEKGVTSHLAVQVNQTSDILEQQRKALNKRDAARTEWIAGVSHDIRTPLAMIIGYAAELEENENLCEEDRNRAMVIKVHSLKIKQLIEDLNLTSKLEYHMQPLRIKSFYPAALLRRLTAEKINGGLNERYELFLEIDGNLEGVAVQGDEELIARAIGNLLNNSICHNPAGCHIYISGSRKGENCVLQVSDDGCGIPGEIIASLEQENNERVQTWKEETEVESQRKKPHIMGLRIAKQIALAHKGGFQIKEEGHTVEIVLPV